VLTGSKPNNVDNLSSVRREAIRHFRKKRGKNLKLLLINLEHTVRTRISEMCVGAFETLRRVISLELIIYKRMRRVICLQTPHCFG
jgi:hypothetical protein